MSSNCATVHIKNYIGIHPHIDSVKFASLLRRAICKRKNSTALLHTDAFCTRNRFPVQAKNNTVLGIPYAIQRYICGQVTPFAFFQVIQFFFRTNSFPFIVAAITRIRRERITALVPLRIRRGDKGTRLLVRGDEACPWGKSVITRSMAISILVIRFPIMTGPPYILLE